MVNREKNRFIKYMASVKAQTPSVDQVWQALSVLSSTTITPTLSSSIKSLVHKFNEWQMQTADLARLKQLQQTQSLDASIKRVLYTPTLDRLYFR